jgi:hypothetical protein
MAQMVRQAQASALSSYELLVHGPQQDPYIAIAATT